MRYTKKQLIMGCLLKPLSFHSLCHIVWLYFLMDISHHAVFIKTANSHQRTGSAADMDYGGENPPKKSSQ